MAEKEYIERNALIEAAKHNIPISRCEADLVDIQRLIATIPAADVAPVAHGRWITKYEGLPFCSACGYNGAGYMAVNWNYCPNCGAKMDENEEEAK